MTALIGILGGMSWQSTELYHRLLNREAERRLGAHHNARTVILSFDYAELLALAEADDWAAVADAFCAAARQLETIGAAMVLISAVTGHLVADQVAAAVSVPLLHIADPTGAALCDSGHRVVALLGTRFTMEHDFIAKRLRDDYGLQVIVPDADDRQILHAIITDELTHGVVSEQAKASVRRICAAARSAGADAIAIACTELPLLMAGETYDLPTFDMATYHAKHAVNWRSGQ